MSAVEGIEISDACEPAKLSEQYQRSKGTYFVRIIMNSKISLYVLIRPS